MDPKGRTKAGNGIPMDPNGALKGPHRDPKCTSNGPKWAPRDEQSEHDMEVARYLKPSKNNVFFFQNALVGSISKHLERP